MANARTKNIFYKINKFTDINQNMVSMINISPIIKDAFYMV